MKKVLFITTNDLLAWGGSEDLWFESALLCLEKGLEVGICITKRNPMPDQLSRLKPYKRLKYFFKEPPVYSTGEKFYRRLIPNRRNTIKEPKYKAEILT